MLKIAIIIGSTRPNRVGEAVGKWVRDIANKRNDAAYDLIDVKDLDLPFLDEGTPPSLHQYAQAHTEAWAARVASYDAFVFVTSEYNHAPPASLKNALDFVYAEWNNKAAGFVSYGSAGGARAVEHLRNVMAELQIADVRAQVMLSLATDFENYTVFKPAAHHEAEVNTMLDQVVGWGGALKGLRKVSITSRERVQAN